MAGARIEFDSSVVQARISATIASLNNPAPLFASINEYLLRIHRQRFKDQISPDGESWAALSPRYLKRKHKNKNKILVLRGYLSGTLRGQWNDKELLFGTDRVYGARQHFGDQGDAGMPARPWLGTSADNDEALLTRTRRYLQNAVSR